MKKFISTLLASLVGFSAFAYDTRAFILPTTGVKNYTRTSYIISSKFGEYFRTPSAKFIHTFNNLGQEIENSELTVDGKLVDKVLYEYDANGNMLSQTCQNQDGTILWTIKNSYKNGLKIEESQYDEKNNLKNKSLFKYEGKNCIDEAYYNGEGALVWKTTFAYDSRGNKIEESSFYPTGELDTKQILKISDDNKILEISYFTENNDEFFEKEIFRYDEKNLLTEIATYTNANQLSARKFFKYDSRGNISKVTTYNITKKFGTTQNELVDITEFSYQY